MKARNDFRKLAMILTLAAIIAGLTGLYWGRPTTRFRFVNNTGREIADLRLQLHDRRVLTCPRLVPGDTFEEVVSATTNANEQVSMAVSFRDPIGDGGRRINLAKLTSWDCPSLSMTLNRDDVRSIGKYTCDANLSSVRLTLPRVIEWVDSARRGMPYNLLRSDSFTLTNAIE